MERSWKISCEGQARGGDKTMSGREQIGEHWFELPNSPRARPCLEGGRGGEGVCSARARADAVVGGVEGGGVAGPACPALDKAVRLATRVVISAWHPII